jgi:hypothetical protein
METKARQSLIALLLVAACAAAAPAEIVQIGLTAEITYIEQYDQWLNENFKLGDIITGSYTYDTDARDENFSASVGDYRYYSPPFGVSLNCNGFTFETDPQNVNFRMGILNDDIGRDRYDFTSYSNVVRPNGPTAGSIGLQLDDYFERAVSSDVLPSTAPDLADWEQIFGLTVKFGYRSPPIIRARLTSVEIVPEPDVWLFLTLGSLLLIGKSRA